MDKVVCALLPLIYCIANPIYLKCGHCPKSPSPPQKENSIIILFNYDFIVIYV